MNQPWIYMYSPHPDPPSHLPFYPIPLGLPSAPGPSTCLMHPTCTPMFIAALFIIARTWKQPRCPSADECIRKLWYIYTMEYYSAIKKNSFQSVVQSCLTLWDPMDCSLPGSSIYGISEARVLEWVAASFSRGSYQSRDWTQVSRSAGRCFTTWATREARPIEVG